MFNRSKFSSSSLQSLNCPICGSGNGNGIICDFFICVIYVKYVIEGTVEKAALCVQAYGTVWKTLRLNGKRPQRQCLSLFPSEPLADNQLFLLGGVFGLACTLLG